MRRTHRKLPWTGILVATIIVIGMAVRTAYFFDTPMGMREYDTNAHIQYIQYMVKHHAIPAAHAGWEFHQSPLYYALGALIWKGTQLLGLPVLPAIRLWSLPLSLITVLACLAIAWQLFPKKRTPFLLFFLLLSWFPLLLRYGITITNDALFYPLAFTALALTLFACDRPSYLRTALLGACIAIGILTKMTALLLIPVAVIALLVAPMPSLRVRFRHLAVLTIVIALLAGWLLAMRLGAERDVQVRLLKFTCNIKGGDIPSILEGGITTFSPTRVLRHPYNNAWGQWMVRGPFWEFVYRSAFFGEWNYGDALKPFAKYLLILGFILFLLIPPGLVAEWRSPSRHRLILLTTGVFFFLALIGYRTALPCAFNQDFRFIPLALVPVLFVIVRGAEILPKYLSYIAYALIILFACSSALFFVLT